MLSRSEIARLIMARIRLAPLPFVPTDREIDLLANVFATLESLRDRLLAPEDTDETEPGSLVAQLRAGHLKAKVSAEAVERAAAVLQSLAKGGLELEATFAEAPVWAAPGGDVLIDVHRQPRAGGRGAAGLRSRR